MYLVLIVQVSRPPDPLHVMSLALALALAEAQAQAIASKRY